MSPCSTSMCSYFFLVLRDHGLCFVYIWKKSFAHALGASVVCHLSLPLINSFNTTEAAFSPCKLCFLRPFPFISLIVWFWIYIAMFSLLVILLTKASYHSESMYSTFTITLLKNCIFVSDKVPLYLLPLSRDVHSCTQVATIYHQGRNNESYFLGENNIFMKILNV